MLKWEKDKQTVATKKHPRVLFKRTLYTAAVKYSITGAKGL